MRRFLLATTVALAVLALVGPARAQGAAADPVVADAVAGEDVVDHPSVDLRGIVGSEDHRDGSVVEGGPEIIR